MYCYRTPTEVLPIGDAAKPHSFATRFSEFVVSLPHPFSIVTTASQLFSEHLSSAQFLQLISTALKVVPSLLSSAQLFSPLPCSSQLPPTILTCAHLVFTLLNFSELISTLLQLFPHLLPSAQLISPLSQLISTLLTFSILASSSQLFSPLVTKMLTQRASVFTHRKLLHTEAFTQRSFYTEKLLHTARFYTQTLLHTEDFTQRSFYTQKLLHRASFPTEKLLHRASFVTEKLLHTEAFTHENFLHTEAFAQRSFNTEKLSHAEVSQQKSASAKMEKSSCHITMGTLMQPLQCDLWPSAAKDNSIAHAGEAARNLNTAITVRSAEPVVQNAMELRATASEIAAPKPDLDAGAKKSRFWTIF